MLKSNERWVLHYLVHAEPVPVDGPAAIDLKRLIRYLASLAHSANAVAVVDNVTLRIQDIRITADYAVLLVTDFDPRGADAAHGDAGTGNVRRLTRRAGESNAYSAHVVIRFGSDQATAAGYPRYRMAIEDVPGLGKTRLLPFLNGLLKNYKMSFSDRQGLKGEYHAKLSLWPFRSESLQSEVEDGELKYFELIKMGSGDNGFDEENFTVEVSKSVKLKPTETAAKSPAGVVLDAIRLAARKKKFSEVKVVYKGREGNQRSATFNPSRQDIDDVIQNKYEMVRLNRGLTQCETTISDELVRQIQSQMGEELSTPDEREIEKLAPRQKVTRKSGK